MILWWKSYTRRWYYRVKLLKTILRYSTTFVMTIDQSCFFFLSTWTRDETPKPTVAVSGCLVIEKSSHEQVKIMLIRFFDSRRVVHKDYVSAGQTVNQLYYRDVLEIHRKRRNRVRPDIARKWIVHRDNSPCHSAFGVTVFLTSEETAVSLQPPYSPYLSPCDFFPFSKVKHAFWIC